MDQQLKTKWITALRSGGYEQGRERLRSANDTYCCLGVLLDLVDPDGWEKNPFRDDFDHTLGENGCVPATDTRQQLGMSTCKQQRLIELNDGGHSFNRIAEYIEANF